MSNPSTFLQEAEFFDRWAAVNAQGLEPVEAALLERYRHPGNLYAKEFCFRLLGNLEGKSILDVGCGEGEDGMILAKLGARVTGLDVSPGAIEVAKERAALNGVAERTRFLCAPLKEASLPPGSFDVIWIDNVLHHVLDDLLATTRALLESARPGALILCIEPVNLNKTLRKIRFLVPVHTEVTPGERPLERHDIAILKSLVPGLRKRHFCFFGRLGRFIIPGNRYERAAFWRRKLCDLVHAMDCAVFAIPGLEQLGGIGVLHGRIALKPAT